MRSSPKFRVAGFIVLVFAVGLFGVLTGQLLRGKLPRFGKPQVSMPAPTSLLIPGVEFPDVVLSGEGGSPVRTVEMIASTGCVVLFLDLECPPCEEMTVRWQRAADEGVVAFDQLWAVTYQPRNRVEAYIDRQGVTFPVLVDTARTFLREYEVNRFPLEVVVGSSGVIRAASYDSATPIDEEQLAEWLSE